MIRRGHQPTIAEVAEAAGIHRATAYRYFPTPNALLEKTTELVGAADPEEMFLGIKPEDPFAMMDAAVRTVSDFMFQQEAMLRNRVRVSVDRWFEEQGKVEPDHDFIRQSYRFQHIDRAIDPLNDSISSEEFERLRFALTLVMGAEAMITMRDVCRLEPDEATDVMSWAAAALIHSALANGAIPGKARTRSPEKANGKPPKKAPTKKAPTKKAPTKKATSKRAPSKKAPSKKAPSKTSKTNGRGIQTVPSSRTRSSQRSRRSADRSSR
jgi:AcrR family transcriptional regulator